jgi:DSF synthase
MERKLAPVVRIGQGQRGTGSGGQEPPSGSDAWTVLKRQVSGVALTDLQCSFDDTERAIWAQSLVPAFTLDMLRDVRKLQAIFESHVDRADRPPMRYIVWACRLPGIFNLGGDLALFAELIASQNRPRLQAYARECVDNVYANAVNFGLPIVTIAQVQGDALGGGFECALSSDVIVAERGAKFGLPEILFGLFPGMGAYSFLGRRLGAKEAERMILSGRIHSAEELHELGVVDRLAEDGAGEAGVREYMAEIRGHYDTYRALFQVRQRFAPVSHQELLDIADMWADAATRLSEGDVRKMRRIAASQGRRMARVQTKDDARDDAPRNA